MGGKRRRACRLAATPLPCPGHAGHFPSGMECGGFVLLRCVVMPCLNSTWGVLTGESGTALGVCGALRAVFAAIQPDVQQLLLEFVQPILLHPLVPLLVPTL